MLFYLKTLTNFDALSYIVVNSTHILHLSKQNNTDKHGTTTVHSINANRYVAIVYKYLTIVYTICNPELCRRSVGCLLVFPSVTENQSCFFFAARHQSSQVSAASGICVFSTDCLFVYILSKTGCYTYPQTF